MAAGLHVTLSSTGYSGAVRLVQWCVIALIFLFFLRVVRAVWVEVRPAGPRHERSKPRPSAEPVAAAVPPAPPPPPRRRKGAFYLEVVEPSDRAGRRFDVDGEVTIGRSSGCGVVTAYDIYSSTLHARLLQRDGRLYVEDLGSTNGTFVNSERVAKTTKLGRGDLVQVGATVFKVTR